jgi:hypothetical protein
MRFQALFHTCNKQNAIKRNIFLFQKYSTVKGAGGVFYPGEQASLVLPNTVDTSSPDFIVRSNFLYFFLIPYRLNLLSLFHLGQ